MLEDVLRDRCRLDPNLPVLAGVSGGPDSLCLLGILHAAGYPLVVAHFNHKLRPEADAESEAVAAHARALGLPFVTDSADVRRWAEEQGFSIEEAARTLRYRFLFAAARAHGAQAVVVGHTADDQVETVLMHFLRGAGLAGLKGMEHRLILPVFDPAIPLVRPLLSLWRTDTEAYCREHELTPHFDSTNTDETYFRNRLRLSLIPELEKYNPRFKEALVRTASALQGDYALLQADVDAAWEQVVASTGEGWVAFNRSRFTACASGLQRSLFRRAGELLRPASRDIGFEALERLATAIGDPALTQVDFINGLYLFVEGENLVLAAYEADLHSRNEITLKGELSLEAGRDLMLGNGWILTSKLTSPDSGDWSRNPDPWTAWLDADKSGTSLLLRPRREGDVFQPLGMGGQTVKVREFFINQKLPRRARKNYPLVCAGEEIAWVPGMRIAHPFRVTEQTSQVLKLLLKKLPLAP